MKQRSFVIIGLAIIGFFAAALGIGARPAFAGPLYSVELAFGDVDLTSPTPLSESIGFHSGFEGTNFYSNHAFASAGPGQLGASSEAIIQLTPAVTLGLGPLLNGTDAFAAFLLDDVIIGGPGTEVPGSLNMQLDGGLNATTFAQLGGGVGNEATAAASVTVGANINGNFFNGTQAKGSVWQVDTQAGDGSTFEDGLLTGFTGSGGIITPTVLLPVGTPFTVVLSLSMYTLTDTFHTIPGSRRQAEASSLFENTLSFPLSGPVFNLPAGYTVQSTAGLIVDNGWQGLAGPVHVPEPSAMLLFGSGLAGLAGYAEYGRKRFFKK